MQVIMRPRRQGKTSELIKRLMEDKNALLFVISEEEKKRIIFEYAGPPVSIPGPLMCLFKDRIKVIGKDTLEGCRSHAYIDNFDMVLENIVRGQVVLGSATGI